MSAFNEVDEELTNRLLSPTVHERLDMFPIDLNRYAAFINIHWDRCGDAGSLKHSHPPKALG